VLVDELVICFVEHKTIAISLQYGAQLLMSFLPAPIFDVIKPFTDRCL